MGTKTRNVFVTKLKENENNPDLESIQITKDIFPSKELRVMWLKLDPCLLFDEFQKIHEALENGHKLKVTYDEHTKLIYEVEDVEKIRKN